MYYIRHSSALRAFPPLFDGGEPSLFIWVNRDSLADLWKVQTAITCLEICIIVSCDFSENFPRNEGSAGSQTLEPRCCRIMSMVYGAIYICAFSRSGTMEVIHFMYYPT